MPFTITVDKRSSKPGGGGSSKPSSFPVTLKLSSSTPSLASLKAAIAEHSKRLTVERQRITTEDKKPLLDDDKHLQDLGVKAGDTVYVKDLGPQIAWRTVFLTEYFGPLWIHPLIYLLGPAIFRRDFEHSKLQTTALALVLLHYLKREVETLFVHRFSNGTMPLRNIFKNSFHYWVFSGILLAGAIYSPQFSAKNVAGTIQDSDTFIYSCVAVWALAQMGNAYSHIILKNLRPAGTRERKIPRGFAFELVSCPNYFFETIVWSSFLVLTQSWASALFAAVSVGQMYLWAIKKHKNYRKEFPDYPRSRKAMFPFIA